MGLFVAGTDTGVGKTWVSCRLAAAARGAGRRVSVCKPVAAGAEVTPSGLRNEDAVALIEASGCAAPYGTVNPWCLELAASPHLAARAAGVKIGLERIIAAVADLSRDADWLLVEGAGGWLAPIDERRTMADVAIALARPVVLVVGLRLGCLNHAMLTAEAIRAAGLPMVGWIGNRIDPGFELCEENVATLTDRLGSAPLAVFPRHSPDVETRATTEVAARRTVQELERRLLHPTPARQTQ